MAKACLIVNKKLINGLSAQGIRLIAKGRMDLHRIEAAETSVHTLPPDAQLKQRKRHS